MTISLCGHVDLPSCSHRPWEMFLLLEAVATEVLCFPKMLIHEIHCFDTEGFFQPCL